MSGWYADCTLSGMVYRSETAGQILASAIKVHQALGPGLLESAYQACLKHEMTKRGLGVKGEVPLPVEYDGVRLDCGYRLDFVVNEEVVIEVKSVERLIPIHKAQMLTYLRLTGLHQGLLINFRVGLLKHGVQSVLL